jgi:hypothetical protein
MQAYAQIEHEVAGLVRRLAAHGLLKRLINVHIGRIPLVMEARGHRQEGGNGKREAGR